ncbi:MAG: hypothetical protein HC843_11720 [Sphingomonadales bacterium]|nr:hypothetical protein [Sphingomonadales bacterium]
MMTCLMTTTAFAQPRYTMGNEPVTLSATGTDPCSYGEIVELAPETTISVYPGASEELEAIDELAEATPVWVCETSNDEQMVGIIYGAYHDQDCEISSPVAEDTDYFGPCDSGWVMARDVVLLAG